MTRHGGVDSGQFNSAMTGLYRWIGYKAGERVTVWTVAGYGADGLMLNPGAGTPIKTGLSMAMAPAVGTVRSSEAAKASASRSRRTGAALLRRRTRGGQEGLRAAWRELLDPAKAR